MQRVRRAGGGPAPLRTLQDGAVLQVTWLGGRLPPLLTLYRLFGCCSRRQGCTCIAFTI